MTDTKALVEAGDEGERKTIMDVSPEQCKRAHQWVRDNVAPLALDNNFPAALAAFATSECVGLRAELDAAKKRVADLERVLPDVLYAGTLPYRVQGGTREWDKVEAAARKLLKGA